MKKLLIITYILCQTAGLPAQTEAELYELLKPVGIEQTDSAAIDSLICDPAIAARPWPQDVQARTQLGLLVYDLTADSAIYRCGDRQTLRPASTMKLVTAITALDKLGIDYQFRTSLYYTGRVSNRTLTGNLYCVGGMDPQFEREDMKAFAESIRKLGVDTIRGQIVADHSMKDESRLGEGWCWDDDNPELSPLLIERKDQFLECFLKELRSAGLQVDAPFAEGLLPNGAVILCSRFHPMSQILTKMMKESDNLYAEAVYYQIAASGGVRRASADKARQWERKLIGRIGLNAGEYKLADGSGLSLYNYVTPELMVRLLRFAWQRQDIYAPLLGALPIAGIDGTLEKRMQKSAAAGNVRAKTGTLTGISSLAGYCTAANGHQLCFCIINQGVMRQASGRTFQDKVCAAMCMP